MSRLPEVTRIARVLDIIWRIDTAPRYWTRRRLAEEFEVSERSITSDLEIVRHRLRFDLRSERGQGYYFAAVPKLPAVSYSVAEALALILAAQVGRQFAGIPQHDLSSAVARLSSVFPVELRQLVDRIGSDAAAAGDSHRERVLATCSQAIAAGQRVQISYAAASHDGHEAVRTVDPYAVFPYGRSWHLVGHCHLRDDVRIFKIDRVRSVNALDDRFDRDPEFDLAAFLSSGWGLIRGLDQPFEEVVLRFRPPSARWVAEERWHGSQQVEWRQDGSMLFRVRVQVTDELRRWVFRYGRDVEVLEPDHLRRWIVEEAESVLAGALAMSR